MRALAVDRSLEAIAGPLVAQSIKLNTFVAAPLDPLSSRTLISVSTDRNGMKAYNPLSINGYFGEGMLEPRAAYDDVSLDSRFDGANGDSNLTTTLHSIGSGQGVIASILDMQNQYVQTSFDGITYSSKRVFSNPGNGIVNQTIRVLNPQCLWVGLWPFVMSQSEIRLVSMWLSARWLT